MNKRFIYDKDCKNMGKCRKCKGSGMIRGEYIRPDTGPESGMANYFDPYHSCPKCNGTGSDRLIIQLTKHMSYFEPVFNRMNRISKVFPSYCFIKKTITNKKLKTSMIGNMKQIIQKNLDDMFTKKRI